MICVKKTFCKKENLKVFVFDGIIDESYPDRFQPFVSEQGNVNVFNIQYFVLLEINTTQYAVARCIALFLHFV